LEEHQILASIFGTAFNYTFKGVVASRNQNGLSRLVWIDAVVTSEHYALSRFCQKGANPPRTNNLGHRPRSIVIIVSSRKRGTLDLRHRHPVALVVVFDRAHERPH